MELIPTEAFRLVDKGSYFVDYETLIKMESYKFDEAEQLLQYLMEQNPDFIFVVIPEIMPPGITIYWNRKKDDGPNSSSCVKRTKLR